MTSLTCCTVTSPLVVVYSRVTQLTGYEPAELDQKTLYQFVHPEDAHAIRKAHHTRE